MTSSEFMLDTAEPEFATEMLSHTVNISRDNLNLLHRTDNFTNEK